MRANETRGHFKGHEYRKTVLTEVKAGASRAVDREELLTAAIAANEDPGRGNQNKYLERSELDSGLKALLKRKKPADWYGSTVTTKHKLNPLLGQMMIYGRIIDILDGKLPKAAGAPEDRIRVTLTDGRDDHRGLFSGIIALEKGGDPNKATTYWIEQKMPGKRGELYGPFPMPKAGVPEGENPIIELRVLHAGNRASLSYSTESLPGNSKHEIDKIQIDKASKTITIPWRYYQQSEERTPGGPLYSSGPDFRLDDGTWKVNMTDAITGRVLKRTQVTIDGKKE